MLYTNLVSYMVKINCSDINEWVRKKPKMPLVYFFIFFIYFTKVICLNKLFASLMTYSTLLIYLRYYTALIFRFINFHLNLQYFSNDKFAFVRFSYFQITINLNADFFK